MGAIALQITSLTIVYTTVYSGTDQRKHQSSASLAFGRGIHRWPVNSPHKWPVTRKMYPFDDAIMHRLSTVVCSSTQVKFGRTWHNIQIQRYEATVLLIIHIVKSVDIENKIFGRLYNMSRFIMPSVLCVTDMIWYDLKYAMPWYVMLCYVMLCYGMVWRSRVE